MLHTVPRRLQSRWIVTDNGRFVGQWQYAGTLRRPPKAQVSITLDSHATPATPGFDFTK